MKLRDREKMRLISANIKGYGRLVDTKINLDSKVIAVVGPNEAGDYDLPEDLECDCDKGFGTAKLASSYLLIQKITPKGDLNPTLVDWLNSKWNTILHELIEMHKIVLYAKTGERI